VAYATGKFALAICDRCGFEYKLHELKEEWNNFKTCPECFEPKAPQLDPTPVVTDNEALYNPRPSNDVEVGEGFVVVTSSSIFQADFMNPSILGSNFTITKMTASLGSVTINT
jgi:NAD-dependent SIR2 family protein deacetylase